MHTPKVRLAFLFIISQMMLACSSTGSSGSGDALSHTAWTLSSLPGGASVSGRSATLNFADGRVHGSDGCNRYSGSYALTGDKLRIGGDLAATRMACPEPVMRQADAFTRALTQTMTFRRDSQRLLLLDAGGTELATLREQAHELAATSWTVSGYNNGKDAVVSVAGGTALTVAFSADGKISGTAGCNQYSATYTTSGQNIRIDQPAATRKMCPKPDGVMDQEDRFLRALASAATWRLDGDRLELRTAAGALALSLRATPSAAAPKTTPDQAASSGLAFLCGAQRVLATPQGEALQLGVAGETLTLRQVPSASGARYVAIDDASTSFWSTGKRAALIVRGKTLPECTQTTTSPTPFRATGNEPGWSLEISSSRMAFSGDYGRKRIVAPTPAPETAASYTRYAASSKGHELTATIFDRPCTDTMTGMPYPHAVTVVADGQTLSGCGGDPASLLQGGEWVVEDLNQAGIIDRSRATLSFASNGGISGRSFCNSYSGKYRLTGETLVLAVAATTKKACAPAVMHQENAFFEVLKAVRRFSLRPDGALVVHTDDGRSVLARRG